MKELHESAAVARAVGLSRVSLTLVVLIVLMTSNLSAQSLTVLGPSGGPGGTEFKDGVLGGYWPTELRIRSGNLVDAVQIVYKSKQGSRLQTKVGKRHGGDGGVLKTFTLKEGEYIERL